MLVFNTYKSDQRTCFSSGETDVWNTCLGNKKLYTHHCEIKGFLLFLTPNSLQLCKSYMLLSTGNLELKEDNSIFFRRQLFKANNIVYICDPWKLNDSLIQRMESRLFGCSGQESRWHG